MPPFNLAFAHLGGISRVFYTGAFCAMAAAVGLLITPSMEHLIVERGRSTARLLRVTTCFAGLALLPMGLSLGTDLSIVLTYRFGAAAGVTVGLVASGLALVLWYGAEFLLRRSHKGKPVMDEGTSIDVRIEHMLTEARVLLPGAQALFGFQMAVLLTEAFADLPTSSKFLHAVALCCIALAVILLMAPASIHRITFRGENTESFHRIGSRFVIASAIPLAAGITGDLYVAVTKALELGRGRCSPRDCNICLARNALVHSSDDAPKIHQFKTSCLGNHPVIKVSKFCGQKSPSSFSTWKGRSLTLFR